MCGTPLSRRRRSSISAFTVKADERSLRGQGRGAPSPASAAGALATTRTATLFWKCGQLEEAQMWPSSSSTGSWPARELFQNSCHSKPSGLDSRLHATPLDSTKGVMKRHLKTLPTRSASIGPSHSIICASPSSMQDQTLSRPRFSRRGLPGARSMRSQRRPSAGSARPCSRVPAGATATCLPPGASSSGTFGCCVTRKSTLRAAPAPPPSATMAAPPGPGTAGRSPAAGP
mmetsp:Transcript_42915/g.136385  ORF Transcript_42915/g.136385 Transcript_42915/m.136385 type:complete len:231 (+) Transcript_42915:1181-1873(+)